MEKKQKKWSSEGQNKIKMPYRSNKKKSESKKHNKRKERYYNSDPKSLELWNTL